MKQWKVNMSSQVEHRYRIVYTTGHSWRNVQIYKEYYAGRSKWTNERSEAKLYPKLGHAKNAVHLIGCGRDESFMAKVMIEEVVIGGVNCAWYCYFDTTNPYRTTIKFAELPF